MRTFLAETPEFKRCVEQRKRGKAARMCLLLRIVHAALDGYMEELTRMLDAPIRIAPWEMRRAMRMLCGTNMLDWPFRIAP